MLYYVAICLASFLKKKSLLDFEIFILCIWMLYHMHAVSLEVEEDIRLP